MPDKFDAKTRSKIMSRIRSKDTSIEISFRKILWNAGMKGYRLHYHAPGNPDIAFVDKKIAIFIDGDFWHGYNWKKLGKVPPRKYWQKKISKNIERDKKYNALLKKEGWKVIRLWEHDLKKNSKRCASKIKYLFFTQ
ncbi:very short patch repair endonuclease [Candidatus Woesearchaeota archaeon]|nr:very short patch repair endonuclease [Candidatus Woesearchaeota archaeon]